MHSLQNGYACAGSGALEADQAEATRAQLLGFLLYGSPGFIGRLLEAYGADESAHTIAALEEVLPGPHPVLRCLASTCPGATFTPFKERPLVPASMDDTSEERAVYLTG